MILKFRNTTMWTALFCVLAAAWVCTASYAGTTGVILGQVKSEEGEIALAGVNIVVSGTMLTTVTDAQGRFVITNVPPGEYDVRAELVGYAPQTLTGIQVTMDATARADFLLKLELTEEETVVITRPRPMVQPDITSTLNLVTSQEEPLTRLDPGNVRTAAAMLSALPGVIAETDGSGQMHVRGGRADQIGWYLEGIPITDPNTGNFGTNLFTTGIGKFQAYTGGFGAEYGNAISGVLNEVKKTGASVTTTNLDMEYGNSAYWNAFAESGGGAADEFNYYVGATVQRTDLDAPLVKSTEYVDSVAKLVWPSKNDTYTVLAMHGSLRGLLDARHTTGDLGAPTPDERDFMEQRYNVAAVTWSRNFGPERFLTVRPYFMETDINQNLVGTYGVYAAISSKRTGLQLAYTSQMGDTHLVKIGGSILSSVNKWYLYPGFPFYRADVDTFQRDMYVSDHIRMNDKWTADLGLRWDAITYDRTGREYVPGAGYSGAEIGDVTESVVSPRVGLSYAADNHTVWKTSWGKYCKWVPASSVQRTYFDPDFVIAPGFPTLEAMTASLGSTDPQRSTSLEFSYEKQVSDTLAWRVTPFWTTYENLSDLAINPTTGVMQYTNLGNGRSSGLEFYVRKRMSNRWQGWASYTYQKTRANRADLGFTNAMFYAPWDQRHTLTLVADYRLGKCHHSLRADIGSGRADRGDPTLQMRAGGSFVLSYNFSMDLPKSSPLGNRFYVNVFNLFNNHQTLQYNWDATPARVRDSWVPSRTICMGVSSSF